jgi:hypothetical protein
MRRTYNNCGDTPRISVNRAVIPRVLLAAWTTTAEVSLME